MTFFGVGARSGVDRRGRMLYKGSMTTQTRKTNMGPDGVLDLRDRIAIAALQGILAADVEYTVALDVAADLAYRQADAMLEARKKAAR